MINYFNRDFHAYQFFKKEKMFNCPNYQENYVCWSDKKSRKTVLYNNQFFRSCLFIYQLKKKKYKKNKAIELNGKHYICQHNQKRLNDVILARFVLIICAAYYMDTLILFLKSLLFVRFVLKMKREYSRIYTCLYFNVLTCVCFKCVCWPLTVHVIKALCHHRSAQKKNCRYKQVD